MKIVANFLMGVIWRKQIQAEARNARIVRLLGERGDAFSCLYRNPWDLDAIRILFEATTELYELGVYIGVATDLHELGVKP